MPIQQSFTKTNLSEGQKSCEDATPAPWYLQGTWIWAPNEPESAHLICTGQSCPFREEDRLFVIHSRKYYPLALIALAKAWGLLEDVLKLHQVGSPNFDEIYAEALKQLSDAGFFDMDAGQIARQYGRQFMAADLKEGEELHTEWKQAEEAEKNNPGNSNVSWLYHRKKNEILSFWLQHGETVLSALKEMRTRIGNLEGTIERLKSIADDLSE